MTDDVTPSRTVSDNTHSSNREEVGQSRDESGRDFDAPDPHLPDSTAPDPARNNEPTPRYHLQSACALFQMVFLAFGLATARDPKKRIQCKQD